MTITFKQATDCMVRNNNSILGITETEVVPMRQGTTIPVYSIQKSAGDMVDISTHLGMFINVPATSFTVQDEDSI